jgi:hypothetical protein
MSELVVSSAHGKLVYALAHGFPKPQERPMSPVVRRVKLTKAQSYLTLGEIVAMYEAGIIG